LKTAKLTNDIPSFVQDDPIEDEESGVKSCMDYEISNWESEFVKVEENTLLEWLMVSERLYQLNNLQFI